MLVVRDLCIIGLGQYPDKVIGELHLEGANKDLHFDSDVSHEGMLALNMSLEGSVDKRLAELLSDGYL